jgi:hypothetical protein
MFRPTNKLSCAVQRSEKKQIDILLSTPEGNIWKEQRDKATNYPGQKTIPKRKVMKYKERHDIRIHRKILCKMMMSRKTSIVAIKMTS